MFWSALDLSVVVLLLVLAQIWLDLALLLSRVCGFVILVVDLAPCRESCVFVFEAPSCYF